MELTFVPYGVFKERSSMNNFEHIIEDFICRKEFMLLHATAKTGKSMFALNLGLAVATGLDFLGMETMKGKVMYLQSELADYALTQRIDLMLKGYPTEVYDHAQMNFLISSGRIRLDSNEGLNALKEKVKLEQPLLLIIDPLYDMHSKNEDNANEMAPLLSNIREVAREFGCAVILIHHQGKKNEGYSTNAGHACRGSSAFADVPDSSISLSRDREGHTLRGIFRNRPSLEDFRLKFDDKALLFSPAVQIVKVKTRDKIINALKEEPLGLTKKSLISKLNGVNEGGSSFHPSTIQKQLDSLRAQEIIEINPAHAIPTFILRSFEGRNLSP